MNIYKTLEQIANCETDPSYPSPERQLLMRLEALIGRHSQVLRMIGLSPDYEDDYVCDEETICFSPPEELVSVYLIEKAIRKAKADLQEIYGIDPGSGPEATCAAKCGTASSDPCVVQQLLIFGCNALGTTIREQQ